MPEHPKAEVQERKEAGKGLAGLAHIPHGLRRSFPVRSFSIEKPILLAWRAVLLTGWLHDSGHAHDLAGHQDP